LPPNPTDISRRLRTGAGWVLVVALVCGGAEVMGAATAGAQSTGEVDATVTKLRADADEAAQAYFDALAQSQTLEAQIAAIETELPALQVKRRELRAEARRRAALAYVRAGSQAGGLFDASDAADAARRSQWLEDLNARDHAAFDELAITTNEFKDRQRELQRARDAQQAALDQLEAQRRDIDAKLQAAEDRQRSLAAAATPPRPVVPKGNGGAPPTAPPDYAGTPGTHPQHDQPFLVCTRTRESHGNYAAYNPAGPYMGAYQFHQGTWNSAANHAGRPELIGVPPHTASQYDQDHVAWALYQWQGSGPWGGHCG
jgi:hypothetical protein